MRIAYVGRWTNGAGDGVRAKVTAHADAWRAAGNEVAVWRLPPAGYGGEPRRAIAASVVATARLRRALAAFTPDLIYIRYGLFVPSLAPLQRRLATVVEVNANDRAKSAQRGPLRAALNARSRRSLLGGAGGIVCVSHELAAALVPLGRPICVVANGARLDPAPASLPESSKRPLAIFLVGEPKPWHGLDRLLALAAAMPECDFALIGAERSHLPAPPPGNVHLHPPMSCGDYAPLLARADVGIGSLALRRAGLREASPLKVREYLAHGLPVVLAYEDTDFIGAAPWFVLRLPDVGVDADSDADALRKFLARVRGRRVPREEIAGRIGAEAKEKTRLAFMARVAAAHGR